MCKRMPLHSQTEKNAKHFYVMFVSAAAWDDISI